MEKHSLMSERHYADPRWLYLRSFLWLLLVGYVSDKAATLAAHRNVAAISQCNYTHLPDLVLDSTPDWSTYKIPDFFLYTYFPSLLVYGFNGTSGHAVIYRTSLVYGLLLAVRSITIIATSYPAPGHTCREEAAGIPWRWWGNSFFLWYRTCGDYMFSGHTALLTLVACVHTLHLGDFQWFQGHPQFLHALVLVIWLGTGIGVASLLLCRFHYLCDVVVGAYITATTFTLFNVLPAVLVDAPWVRLCLGQPGRLGHRHGVTQQMLDAAVEAVTVDQCQRPKLDNAALLA